MTQQEILNKVVAHMRAQSAVAVTHDGQCCYRVPDSELRCAIGALIPDDIYSPAFERRTIAVLLEHDYPALKSHFDGMDIDFLCALQNAHDESKTTDEWVAGTKFQCEKRGLTWPE